MTIAAKDGSGADFSLGSVDVGGAHHPTGTLIDPATGTAFKGASEATLEAARVLFAAISAAISNHDAVADDGHAGMVMLAKRRDSDASAMVADGDFGYLSLDENQRLIQRVIWRIK